MLAWFGKIFTSKTLGLAVKILAPALVFVALFAAGVWSGWNWKAAKVAKADYSTLLDKTAELARIGKAAQEAERQGHEAVDTIRTIHTRAVVDLRDGCRLSEPDRVRFNETISDLNSVSGTSTVPSEMPVTEAND